MKTFYQAGHIETKITVWRVAVLKEAASWGFMQPLPSTTQPHIVMLY